MSRRIKLSEIDKAFVLNENNVSKWVTKDEIKSNFPNLDWGNNGVTRNGLLYKDDRYNWEFKRLNDKKNGKILAIRINGLNERTISNKNHPISDRIHKEIRGNKESACVVCGSKSDLVTDHKNDLYNDPRVLSEKTQTFEDFQCLCNHCNLQKRQVSKKTRETNKRYGATNIPQLKVFGIDFISGDENYDPEDPNAMVGTYWYDPLTFMSYIENTLSRKN
tara:strand:+ start:157 stop:816 length:660 start_codon:yes stop_codon:yes gene_type:complete